MSEPIRLAILGTGRMGAFHARTLARLAEIELVAVVDQLPESATRVADETGSVALSLEDLVGRHDVEAWLIATPTPTHPGLVQAGLDAGLHVLCEKPVSLDPGRGSRLGDRASDLGLVLQVGFWRRFSPPWARAREMVDEGAIGAPVLIRLSQWDADPPPPAFCDPAVSGGLAIDCGVHEYDLAEWLTGSRVDTVVAHNLPIVDPAVGDAGDVDNLVALLELENGTNAIVDLSRNARYGDDVRTEILGSDGALFVETLPAGLLRLAGPRGVSLVEGSQVADATEAGIVAQARAFAAAIRNGSSGVPGGADSDRAVRIGLAVQQSASSGESVTV